MIADKLKKSVLQAAIQGKIKSDKKLPPITAEEIPFDIPTNWTWCRLGDICNYGTNSTVRLYF